MLSEGPLAARIREIAERIKAQQQAARGASVLPSPPPAPIPEPQQLPMPAPEDRRPTRPGLDNLAGLPETSPRDLIAAYKAVLTRLYELAALGPDADPAECRQLLQQQWKLADELGPAFAEAVDRQHSRVWGAQHQQCPSCGDLGVYHDLDTGETIPIDLDTIVRWTAHEPHLPAPGTPGASPSGPRDTSGWRIALPGLGPRRAGPFSPCTECTRGTFARYGGRPLCLGCADAWGTR